MCGIGGIISICDWAFDPEVALSRMSESLRDRGPDGEGTYLDLSKGVGMTHRRLAIFDPSESGAQPMTSKSGRFTLVFNGAVYNYLEIRQDLETLGHTFKSNTDTEVILTAFDTWGIKDSLNKFNGMFVFAVMDRSINHVVLIRDRLGQKPLCLAVTDGHFAFGSTTSSLEVLPDPFKKQLSKVNPVALQWYLANGAVPWPLSIRQGIEHVPPGGMISIDLLHGHIERESWWNPPSSTGNSDSTKFDNGHKSLSKTIENAVKIRLRADQPVGILLSGGIDSRIIAAFSAIQSPTTPSFTLELPGAFNESVEAAAIANQIGIPHHRISVTERELISVCDDIPRICDEPFADASLLATTLLSRCVKKHVGVALGGDGGDELFGGYRRHFAANRKSQARRAFLKFLSLLPPSLTGRISIGRLTLHEAINRYRMSHSRPIDYLGLRATQGNAGSFLQGPLRIEDAESWIQRLHSAAPPWGGYLPTCDGPRSVMQADLRSYLPDDPLVKIDRASMSVALEIRSPFLDTRVIDAAHLIPTSSLFDSMGGKVPLRRILEDMNLDAKTTKKGFAVPLYSWLRGPLKGMAESLLLEDPGDPIDQDAIESAWKMLCQGRKDLSTQIWTLMCWRSWIRQHSNLQF